jgi:hypothetical protein
MPPVPALMTMLGKLQKTYCQLVNFSQSKRISHCVFGIFNPEGFTQVILREHAGENLSAREGEKT